MRGSVRGQMGHAEARRRGWERVDPRPWTKLAARWRCVSGWWLEHCGHPTANWPWALYAPDGRMHLTGGLQGKPDCGRAWPTLREAMDYVAQVQETVSPRAPGGAAGGGESLAVRDGAEVARNRNQMTIDAYLAARAYADGCAGS